MSTEIDQIVELERTRDILIAERRVIVGRLRESGDTSSDIEVLVKHQDQIETIERIILHEKSLVKPTYNLDFVG